MKEKCFIRVLDTEYSVYFINIYNINYWFKTENGTIRIYLIGDKFINCINDDKTFIKLCQFVDF